MNAASSGAGNVGPATPRVPVGAALVGQLAPLLGAVRAGTARLVVGFGGESGSGKSETARAVAEALGAEGIGAIVLHQDDYFLRPPYTNHAWRQAGGLERIGPHEVDLPRLAAHIAAFRRGADDVTGPRLVYAEDRFAERRLDFAGARVLCVEGTYVLTLESLDARVFFSATYAQTAQRRVARARAAEELTPFVARVLAHEHALIAPLASRADVIVDADFRIVLPR